MKRYKKYIIGIVLIIALCASVCFIPIDATRFAPNVEKQIADELGIKIHIDQLIFRFGPSLKIKSPNMELMYNDGQKFGQLNNVKFFVPWSTLIKDDVVVKKIYADSFVIETTSEDKCLPELMEKLKARNSEGRLNITLHNYNISYKNIPMEKLYSLSGSNIDLSKRAGDNNFKLSTDGSFFINKKAYLTYNLSLDNNVEMVSTKNKFSIQEFIDQIESLDFYSDIMADLKINKNSDGKNNISGLVNIDNMSVLDPNKKTPKSFIYLTFLGNKIGIQSNIYATGDKKIYAEGVINNSKRPELDIKVKTDEINIADAFKKVKPLIDLSNLKDITSIDGKLIADFTLKGDLNKIKSYGYFKVTDGSIKSKNLNINNITSNIDFSNNVITISDTQGFVNNAAIILSGKIDKELNLEVLMNKVELKHLIPETFGIENGIMSLKANITGTLDNIIHKENLNIEKFKVNRYSSLISFDSLNIDTNKENTAYISNIRIQPKNTELIKVPMLKLQIENNKITMPDTNIFMPNSKLQANANIVDYTTQDYTFNFKANGFLNSKDLSGFTKISNIYPLKINISGNNEVQNIDSQIHLQKPIILEEPSLLSLNSKIENGIFKIDELSIIPFNDNLIKTDKINSKASKKLIISGNIENLNNPILKNIRVYIPQQLNIILADTVAQIKGDVFLNGKISNPEIIGQISAQNIINQFIQLSLNNATIDFNKDIAIINAPIIRLADSSLGINASVSTDLSKELNIKNINVKSKYINADTLLMYKDAPLFNAYPISINDGKFYAERAMMTLYGSPLYFSALTSNFKMKDKVLTAKDIFAELFNGKLSGSMTYNIADNTFDSNLMARGVSAAPIFNVAVEKKDALSGVMDFDAAIKGNIYSRDVLNGDIKFEVKNGHLGTLGKLEHLLYAQNVIADSMLRTSLSVVTKAITLKDTGLFKYLRGDIALSNGIANIKLLQSQGPSMSLFVKGQYHSATDYAKLTVLGRISDEVVAGLGSFGEFSFNKLMIMLTGEENKLNITADDLEKLPQLSARNTKEFRAIINGIMEKPSSVTQFNWISYTQKSLRQKDVPMTNEKLPSFVENLPY